jgi:hypothetical protein
LECRQKNRWQSTTHFQIKKLFFGVEVKVVGFGKDKGQLLADKINQNGGHAVVLGHNSELNALANSEDRTSVILTNSTNFGKLKHFLSQIPYPIVGLDWLEDSFNGMLCKYPFDYAFNQSYIYHKEPIEHFPKMKKKLDLQLTTQPIDQFQPKILENTFIHLSPNIHPELAGLLKKLIMVYGGFYLEEPSPIITHILTEPVTE